MRLEAGDGQLAGVMIKRVSCPVCDRDVELPDDAKAGDFVTCCGKTFRLTYEFGAFAAEPLD